METSRHSSLAGVTGGVEAGTTVVKAYNPNAPGAEAWLNAHFPRRYNGKSHQAASEEIHSQNKFFKTVKEREIAQQLIEEGRLLFDEIEGSGFPGGALLEGGSFGESLGEIVRFITHPSLAWVPGLSGAFGSSSPPQHKISTAKVGGQTLPKSASSQSGGQAGQEEIPSILGGLPWLQIAELVGGAALVMFGLVQLGQKAGISVPNPRP